MSNKLFYPRKTMGLLVCFFLSILISGGLMAQGMSYYNQIKQVNESGANPVKAEMKVSLDSPVNPLTGAACFDIPIYTIKEGNYSLPISLHYQTSGFKVVDLSSNVGLGWSIEAGGCISRTVKGFIDESNQVGYCSQVGEASTIHNEIIELSQVDNIDTLLTPQDTTMFATLLKVTDNLYDAEPDVYSFSFCGYSGSFVFDMDNQIHLIPEQNFDIEKTSYGFVITVDNGDKYYFGEDNSTELVRNTFNCPLFMTVDDFETYIADNGQNYTNRFLHDFNHSGVMEWDHNYPVKWFLSRIELSGTHKSILFEYETDDVRAYLGTDETYMRGKKFSSIYSHIFVGGFDWIVNRVNRYRFSDVTRLSRISWSNGTIDFIPMSDYREDLDYKGTNSSNGFGGYAIKQIVISSTDDGIGNSENYSIDLNQSYYVDINANGSFPQVGYPYEIRPYYKRLILNNIVFKDLDNNSLYNYSFDYNYYRFQYCPSRNSCEVDYWGYFKPRSGFHVERFAIKPPVYYYQNGKDNPLYNSDYSFWRRSGEAPTCFFEGSDLTPNANTAKLFTLKTVILPTGGRVEFNYELNDFFFDSQDIVGPGVRVKSVNYYYYSNDGNNYLKEYSYKINGHSSGKIAYIPNIGIQNLYPLIEDGNLPNSDFCDRVNGLTARQFSTVTDMSGINESKVQYEKITETCRNNTNNLGKTIYYHELNLTAADSALMIGEDCFINKTHCKWTSLYQHPDLPSLQNPLYSNPLQLYAPPSFTYPIISWYNGFLTKKEQYDSDNKLVESTEYKYRLKPSEDSVFYIQSKYLCKYATAWTVFDDQQQPTYNFPIYQYDILWGVNYYKTGVRQLDTIIHKYYSEENDNLANVATRTFNYTVNNYVSEERTENSDGSVIKQTYNYPLEYATCYPNSVYADMLDRNMLNSVVEQYTSVDNKVTQGACCRFETTGSNNEFIKPEKLFKLRTNNPLTNFQPLGQDSHYELTDEMKYDPSSGNLVEIWDESDGRTTYVWGFHNSLLLAKIQNATDSEVRNALSCTMEALQEKTDTNELIGIFQNLRTSLPSACVTSYAYDLFQNLVSITDPSGKTNRFEYDDALRLKLTRDVENNILQKYEYHYHQ